MLVDGDARELIISVDIIYGSLALEDIQRVCRRRKNETKFYSRDGSFEHPGLAAFNDSRGRRQLRVVQHSSTMLGMLLDFGLRHSYLTTLQLTTVSIKLIYANIIQARC